MIGWHGTVHDFDAFSEERLGSAPDRSANGMLGVWVFLVEGLAENVDGRVLQVEADTPNTLRLPLRAMMDDNQAAFRSGDPRGFFATRRRDLLSQGYQAIEVVEKDGAAVTAVILDLDAITSVVELAPAPKP